MLSFSKRVITGFVLILGIMFIYSANIKAQPQRMSVEERVKILKDSLSLSDEQATKITKILEDQREEMTTVMSENRGDRDAMRTVMQEMKKKTDVQIKAVLTDAQTKKYEEMLKARQMKLEKRRKDGGKR